MIRKVLPTVIAREIVGVQPMSIGAKTPETWQGYLRRLGNGLNGVATNKYITAEDIIDNAQKCMQINYPGQYTVEQFYNAESGRFDLRLKFDDPKEEIVWLLRWT